MIHIVLIHLILIHSLLLIPGLWKSNPPFHLLFPITWGCCLSFQFSLPKLISWHNHYSQGTVITPSVILTIFCSLNSTKAVTLVKCSPGQCTCVQPLVLKASFVLVVSFHRCNLRCSSFFQVFMPFFVSLNIYFLKIVIPRWTDVNQILPILCTCKFEINRLSPILKA